MNIDNPCYARATSAALFAANEDLKFLLGCSFILGAQDGNFGERA
jgi:hypothetical protein